MNKNKRLMTDYVNGISDQEEDSIPLEDWVKGWARHSQEQQQQGQLYLYSY